MDEGQPSGVFSPAEWEVIGENIDGNDSTAASNQALEAIAFSVATSAGDVEVALSSSAADETDDSSNGIVGAARGLCSVSLDTAPSVRLSTVVGVGGAAAAKTEASSLSVHRERLLLELEDVRGELRKARFASDANVQEVLFSACAPLPLLHVLVTKSPCDAPQALERKGSQRTTHKRK